MQQPQTFAVDKTEDTVVGEITYDVTGTEELYCSFCDPSLNLLDYNEKVSEGQIRAAEVSSEREEEAGFPFSILQ